MTAGKSRKEKEGEREECVNQYYGSVLLALNSTRPGQKHGTWSQIFNLLEAHLDRPIRPLKKASKVVESHASHDESSASCRIVFPFYFSRVLLVNTFAQVCSQHICTVVCSLTHKLCGTHSLSLWHTQTHKQSNPGAYVISSMHMIPHTQTHTLTKSDCYSWLAVPRSRYQGPRHTKALCHLLCRCSLLLPASQPALRCH